VPSTAAIVILSATTGVSVGERSMSMGVTDGGLLARGTRRPAHRNLFDAPIATHQLLRAHAGGDSRAYRSEGQTIDWPWVVNLSPNTRGLEAYEIPPPPSGRMAVLNSKYLSTGIAGQYPRSSREAFGSALWAAVAAGGLRVSSRPDRVSGCELTTPAGLRPRRGIRPGAAASCGAKCALHGKGVSGGVPAGTSPISLFFLGCG